ncbi:hypothetical protein KUV26_20615 [Leisingera daeponensis]|uniref:Uncharacterized protein n=1 Tax=Leisingera daeponensis TaxID=405746 RepID=A0ABS7NNZ8_9RHOB|nr:hypothetical protein [Leisingera daeponensis]MBY6141846.1 hypothetical protein [Leisingera daeponensis]
MKLDGKAAVQEYAFNGGSVRRLVNWLSENCCTVDEWPISALHGSAIFQQLQHIWCCERAQHEIAMTELGSDRPNASAAFPKEHTT